MRIASYQDWPQLVPALLHFLSAPWRWISTRTRLWANALAFLSTRCLPATTLAASLADATPLTEEQRANRKAEFIQSIDREAICALASRHNHGLPCRLDASEPTANGSFNVCFFVEFHTTAERTQWVVRVPIEPVISRTWEKVQSEVCTIRYLRAHTSIPVPQVHAYGRARLRFDESTENTYYMILERVGGRPLTDSTLLESSMDHRQQFFTDLIAILAQLRGLDFKTAGSLMPGQLCAFPLPGWLQKMFSPKPAVVSAISIPSNELDIQKGAVFLPPREPPTSTVGFVALEHRLLWDMYLLPKQDLTEASARGEVFALHTLQQQPPLPEHNNNQPEQFILTHTDLRGPNIMVDDQLRIQAIIDWEWAVTVPAAFFQPPFWITASGTMLADFRSTLASLPSAHDPSIVLLQKQWLHPVGDDLTMHMARIFQDPYSLSDIFYKSVYPRLFSTPKKETLENFFLSTTWRDEIGHRIRSSERYTQYLKANNLYKVDEEEQQRKEWAAGVEALLRRLKQ